MQRTCTASCSARVRPHARRWTASCILRVRPHAFFVYGIMHFYVDSLMQALFIVHTYLYQGFIFIEINAILVFSIHSINSLIHYSCTIKLKLRLDQLFERVLVYISKQFKPMGWAGGFKSRICPPYPHACRKRRLKWAFSRKKGIPCRCLDGYVKEPCEMSMALGARP